MNITTVIHQMLILLFIIGIGYLANKMHYLNQDGEKALSRLIVNITNPATIIVSAVTANRMDSATMTAAFLYAFGFFLLMPFVLKGAARLFRIPKSLRGDYEAMLLYGNIGFMGIPVIGSVLGPDALLLLTIFMAVFNVSVFSYGAILISGEKGSFSPKRVCNAGSLSAVLAIILYLLGVRLPPLLLQTTQSIASVTTPLAMMVIGSSLANQPLKTALQDRQFIPLTLLRLLGLPLFIFLLCRPLITDPTLLGVLVLTSGMPVASTVVMLKNESGLDGSFVSRSVFVTTILSVATIPLLALMLQYFGR